MINTDSREILKNILLTIPTARLVSGGREVLMRCRYCEDSRDPKSAHMYVSLGTEDCPPLFNCYKCHTTGVVTHDKLLSWCNNINPNDLIEIIKYNKKILSSDNNRRFRDSEVYRLYNNYISMNVLSEAKLNYINKRLGQNLTYDELLNKKIALNLNDLLLNNNIQKFTRHDCIMDELDQSFLGFISQDNAFVNLRNLRQGKVNKTIDKKYVNYNIFNKIDNTQRYYTLPTEIDLFNPNKIRLNIAEGPFDILSIYYNLRNQDNNNCIYSAILGSGYFNICRHFIKTMGFINLEIHLYKDNDIEDRVIYELKDMMYVYQIPFYVHTNIYPGEKDFGVPIERINEQIIRII